MTNKQAGANISVESRRFPLKHALVFLILSLFIGEGFLAGQYYL